MENPICMSQQTSNSAMEAIVFRWTMWVTSVWAGTKYALILRREKPVGYHLLHSEVRNHSAWWLWMTSSTMSSPVLVSRQSVPYFLSTWVLLVINDQYWHHFKGTYIFLDICVLVVSVNCTFDEDLCGYTADSDWSLERRANSSTSKSFQIKCNKSFGNLIPLIGKSNQIHVPFATYSLPTKIIWRWAVWIFDYCHVPVTCQVCFFKKLMSCLLINYFSNLICCLHRWILCNGPKSNVLLNCHLGFGVSTCHWGRKLIMRAAGDDEVYIRSWCFQNNVRLFWGEEMWRCTVFDIFGSDL